MKKLTKNIFLIHLKEDNPYPNFECIERKGKGHPDTLADALAEEFSRVYSNYTLSNFGAILHHNFDKVGLLGGQSYVSFGKGYLTKPIRVLLNGRASVCFGHKKIPVKKLLEKTARNFLSKNFPIIDKQKDIEIHFNLSNASSPGRTDEPESGKGTRGYWFQPRGLYDLKELTHLRSNDTSLGCAYAPLSSLEKTVLTIEKILNSESYHKKNPWLGSDIKVMASRIGEDIDLTICIPQIANYVPNVNSYHKNLEKIKLNILKLARKISGRKKIKLHLNTRDDFSCYEIYLTAIGSSIESGDEGLAGRGNRTNSLITPNRPMSIEAPCGKNPVYHVGKIYNTAAQKIANKLYKLTKASVQIFLISQSGRSLVDPWKTIVAINEKSINSKEILKIIQTELKAMPQLTQSFLKGEIDLF